GARVVNLSLGDALPVAALQDPAFTDAVEWAWSNGAVPVVAAGNNTVATSASYGSLHAIVVAATGPHDSTPYYSSSVGDARWGIAAPGGDGNPLGGDATTDVLSTYWARGKPNDYDTDAGTSMAAPHVAGVVALVLAQGVPPAVAVDRVLAGADRFSCGANCRGRLNAAAAVGAGPKPATSIPATSTPRTPPAAGGSTGATRPGDPQTTSVTTSTPAVATSAGERPAGSEGDRAAGPAVPNRQRAPASSLGQPAKPGHGRGLTATIAGILIAGVALAMANVRRRTARGGQ
ncbi:MAG TPA: S8 family serine peptidase, partial [Mycobacteriales bacterium]|nr:S8 family serine peptidase [Mycobacteriales bacterium]